jgi:hypothetical protein
MVARGLLCKALRAAERGRRSGLVEQLLELLLLAFA